MHRRMSAAQLQYYMKRLRLFWTQARVARHFNTSALTIIRWENGISLPYYTRLVEFEDALDLLIEELHKKDIGMKFMKDIGDALLKHAPPHWEEPPDFRRDTTHLKTLLISKTSGKTVRSTEILKETDALGFSRAQVYKYAHQVGIHMDMAQPGRGGYSLWSLRRRSPRIASRDDVIRGESDGSVRKQREQKPATPVQSRFSSRDTRPSAKPHKASPKAKRS